MTAQRNTNWQARVKQLLRMGYGVEDIAIQTRKRVSKVRAEVEILRVTGKLTEIYRRQG